MKMKKLFAICLVALSALISVHLQAQEVETLVLIDTDMGKIKVKLFNDTPQHRDNFIKNVKEHRYDGLLFHRVIKQFMVQAGDINSKDAPMEQHLGDGDLDYTIPAEIVYPKYFHKRGMFAADSRAPTDKQAMAIDIVFVGLENRHQLVERQAWDFLYQFLFHRFICNCQRCCR